MKEKNPYEVKTIGYINVSLAIRIIYLVQEEILQISLNRTSIKVSFELAGCQLFVPKPIAIDWYWLQLHIVLEY